VGASAAILIGAGAGISAFSQINAGRMARLAGDRSAARMQFQAKEAEYQAGQVVAESQLAAAEQRRQADLVASRSLAVAAASGAGVSDPTVMNVIARTKGEGVYRASLALYEGVAKARSLRVQSAFDELAGDEASLQGRITEGESKTGALGTLVAGAGGATSAASKSSSLYTKYGMSAWSGGGRGDSSLILDTGTTSRPVA
jgi:hypothetical protein